MHHRVTRTDVRAMRCSGNREYGKGGGVEKVWNGTLLFVRFRKKRTSCVASSRPSARARAAAVGACSSRHLVSCRVGEIVVCTRTFSLAFAASAASAIAKASATVAGASKRGSPGATRSSTSRASTSSASRRVMRSRKDTCADRPVDGFRPRVAPSQTRSRRARVTTADCRRNPPRRFHGDAPPTRAPLATRAATEKEIRRACFFTPVVPTKPPQRRPDAWTGPRVVAGRSPRAPRV